MAALFPAKRLPLFQRFLKSLATFHVTPGMRIVVAVSGGPDSVCLLHFFRKWVIQGETDQAFRGEALTCLHVAHLNHGFRPEADEEAEFVANLCQSWGIAHTIEKRPVATFCKEKHLSKQVGARLVRYAFLGEVARHQNARWIALGHTADDGAETFLMNLIRGAGTEGLRGIPPIREGKIIRPMLSITRNDIMRELQDQQIPYREDPSNRDQRFLRNRVRHDLIPLLGAINPQIKKTLIHTATLLADENHFLDEQVEALAPQLCRIVHDEVAYDFPRLCLLHTALQRRLIRWGLRRLRGDTQRIGFDPIEAILTDVLSGRDAKPISLPHGLSAQKRGQTLYLTRLAPETPSSPPAAFEFPVGSLRQLPLDPVTLDVPSWKMQLRLELRTNRDGLFSKDADTADLDGDKTSLSLGIRSWKPGDRFSPLGMGGRRKKLQDFFMDRKISRDLRPRIPLLVGPDGILWVMGYAVDERYRVTSHTKTILRIRVQK